MKKMNYLVIFILLYSCSGTLIAKPQLYVGTGVGFLQAKTKVKIPAVEGGPYKLKDVNTRAMSLLVGVRLNQYIATEMEAVFSPELKQIDGFKTKADELFNWWKIGADAAPQVNIYGKVGLGFTRLKQNDGFRTVTFDDIGYGVGLGIDIKPMNNFQVSFTHEYKYAELETESYGGKLFDGIKLEFTQQVTSMKLAYMF